MWRQQKVASTYVIVRVTSNSAERFLNMCRHKGIVFWDIARNQEGFEGKITRSDFLQLRDVCRKTRSQVRIMKKKGLRFLLFKYRKHYSFLAGILLSCILLYGCSLFVWDVSFTGNSEYTDSLLVKYLTSIGVQAGIPIKEIDCNLVERSLRSAYDDITWVSAEISGTRLIVHIKENDGAKEIMQDYADERDIVATESGTVSTIVTRKGTPKVKPGDTVEKGQILVSGVVAVHNDGGEIIGKIYTSADADISITTTLDYEEKLEITHDVKCYTGREKKKHIFSFLNKDVEIGLSFGSYNNADIVTETTVMKLTDNFCLPLKIGSKVYLEYNMQTVDYTPEEAAEILNSRFSHYLHELIQKKVEVIENHVDLDTDGVCFMLSGNLVVNMPAFEYTAITDDIVIQETKDPAQDG